MVVVEHKSEMKIYFIAIVRIPTPATPKVALLQGKQRLKKSVFGVVCSFGCGIKILRIVKKKRRRRRRKESLNL